MVEIMFLGTSPVVPTAKRSHNAILLSHNDEKILVDCGEGTQRQFRKAGLSPCKLTKILISHWHGDHVLGLPGLIQTLALNGYNKELQVYGPKGTKKFMEEMFRVFVFTGDRIKIKVEDVEGKFFENEDFYLEAFPLSHGPPTIGYNFVIKDSVRIDKAKLKKLKIKEGRWLAEIKNKKDVEVEGKRIKWKDLTYEEEGKKVSFVFDTGFFPGIAKNVEKSDMLIIESTYSKEEAEEARDYKHLTSEQAAEIAKKARVGKLVLTHISQRYEADLGRILKEAKQGFKNSVLAEDFMVLKL